jgi:hypothetical protein
MSPPRSKATPTNPANTPSDPASRVATRRVRSFNGAGYKTRAIGPTGQIVEVIEFAEFGEEITAPVIEILRLDHGGHLAPPGATLEDIKRERDEKIARYRASRSMMPATA